jgi:hypothetical protein
MIGQAAVRGRRTLPARLPAVGRLGLLTRTVVRLSRPFSQVVVVGAARWGNGAVDRRASKRAWGMRPGHEAPPSGSLAPNYLCVLMS